ncbi:hypothetical protein DNTS_003587 [Danionella cerebrum]|uniref:rRNA-processing protein UTP23 homolog n=1 Tax=Danionella cerebrum TaxID=2873325 RepID=A0A553RHN6_9TELE|nr:hypothetical protein DNTS_003587 [Danionella translucida]
MKIKRQKHAKKTIIFYKYNFYFREPFQILIDGTFCQAALKNKIQIKEQLPKYLMGDVQLCTTSCALKELETLSKDLYGAKLILQRFQTRKCNHMKDPISASACFLSMVEETNPHHYFIATQDQELTTALRKIPGIPLLYIILNTMVLDKVSEQTLKHVEAVQLGQIVNIHEKKSLQSLKEKEGIGKDVDERRGRKRKRKSGNPNPLSCLKKKKKPKPPQPKKSEEAKKKRSRHRKRKGAPAGEGMGTSGSVSTN